MNLINELRLLAEDLHLVNPSSHTVKVLSLSADRISKLEAENAQIRALMDSYNLGGWTDSLALIKERDQLAAKLKETDHLLKDLLAVMHRDGGQHAFAVGIEQAVEDAKEVYFAFRDASDKLKLLEEQAPAAWPTMPPSKGQSSVLFEDGYAEGWHRCLSECKKLYAAPVAPSMPVGTTLSRWCNNVASQCRATATSHIACQVIVDGGNGTLQELLNDAADAITSAQGVKP